MTIRTKTELFAILDAQAALRNIRAQDVKDLWDSTECGAAMRLPSQGVTPVTDSITGTSWQDIDLLDTGSATPAAGGYGLTPNLAAGTLTVEAGGAGLYELKYHINLTASEDTEIAINRNRGAANAQAVESRAQGGVLSSCSGSDFVSLQVGDVLRWVARTGGGLTSNLQFWSAQLTALRVLPG